MSRRATLASSLAAIAAAGALLVAAPARADTVPTAPGPVSAVGYETSVRVAWYVPGDDGGSPVTGYRVRDTLSGATWAVGPEVRPATLGPLGSGVTLKLRVAAVNAVGTGPESPAVTVSTHARFAGPVWKPAKNLVAPRTGAASVVLKDGRVLVVGGAVVTASGTTGVRSAEIYSPATRTWTAIDEMPSPRDRFTLTALANGKVLLAGGFTAAGVPDRRAWLLDPAIGHWTPTGAMHSRRGSHSATLLRDGTVLVAGGYDGSTPDTPTVTATSETFDPATGTWTKAGNLLHARSRHLAVRLAERAGRVLVAGGNPGGDGLRSSELYRPTTRTWVATGSMVVARIHDDAGAATATRLTDGRVLVAGGYRFGPTAATTGPQRTAEIYTPATGRWAATRPMPFATEAGHTATLLPGGTVVVAGGRDDHGHLAVTQLFHPATGRWTRGNDLRVDRYEHVAAPLPGGRVLVAGGQRTVPYTTLRSSEVLTP